MTAISFQEEWLNMLLQCNKQQTTRKQTDRIKVGDICSIYNQQRRRITDKMMRCVTPIGEEIILEKIRGGQYPEIPDKVYIVPEYYAHFLGKVEITEVYDIRPCEMSSYDLELWARNDGFKDFNADFCDAETWFRMHYGDKWMQQTWTVIRWDGWLERYFEPESPCIPSMNERSAPATFDCDHQPRGSQPD